MKPQQIWHLCSMLTWMFVTLLSLMCTGNSAQELHLESRVFVAFAGEDVSIKAKLWIPVDQTEGVVTCFNPSNTVIYSHAIPATAGKPKSDQLDLELKNLIVSGEYYCRYKTATAYWFLRVRAEGYKELMAFDRTEFTIVVITCVLLVFSVVGSVYVFRGHRCGHTNREQKQNQEDRKANNREEDNEDMAAAHSSSFYASLEPRPRSVYDVLDRTAAHKQTDQKKAKAKEKDPKKTVQQPKEKQAEDAFESVYENF